MDRKVLLVLKVLKVLPVHKVNQVKMEQTVWMDLLMNIFILEENLNQINLVLLLDKM